MSLEKNWRVIPPIPGGAIQALEDYNEGFRQLLYNRGISTAEAAQAYITAEGSLHDPFLLDGMEKTVSRILAALSNREKIVIYGDYDVDGVSATALLVKVLTALGGVVDAFIPNRFEEGYGLSIDALENIAQTGARLIITVDCGIRAMREACHASQLGIDLIVSDHHHPGTDLPPAFEVINPKKPESRYPERNLAGVGVAFKIAEALIKKISNPIVRAEDFLDLVALGTVADIVPLVGENRTLVKAGIKKMRFADNIGLNALAGVAGINIRNVSAREIGFMLGPRLNAAGRLESAMKAYQLLVAQDPYQAGLLAQELDNLNRKRQGMVMEMVETALEDVSEEQVDNIILSFNDQYEQGVVGLVASRLTEQHYRPSIVGQIKGDLTVASCRSIPEFHITNALDQVADLFEKHGGHDMAAGFTIQTDRIPDLCMKLEKIASIMLEGQEIRPTLYADMDIPLRKLPSNILERIEQIEPTGQANPEVVFLSKDVEVIQKRTVGNGQHLSLILRDGSKRYPAIAFRRGDLYNDLPDTIDILYNVMRNEYNNAVSTQLNLIDIKYSKLPQSERD